MRGTVTKMLRKMAQRSTGGMEAMLKDGKGKHKMVSFSGMYKAAKRAWPKISARDRGMTARAFKSEEELYQQQMQQVREFQQKLHANEPKLS